MKLWELKQKRAEMMAEWKAILDYADEEKRGLTRSEQAQSERMYKDIQELDKTIEKAEVEALEEVRKTGVTTTNDDFVPHLKSASDKPKDTGVRLYKPGEEITPGETRDGISLGRAVQCMMPGGSDTLTAEERSSLSTIVDADGGITVSGSVAKKIVDNVRNNSVCVKAGMVTTVMDSQEVTLPKLAQDPSGEWITEGGQITGSGMEFEGVKLKAHTLRFRVKASEELLQDAPGVDKAIEQAISEAGALEVDRVALLGSGSGEQPRGIYNVSGVTKTAVSSDGPFADIADSLYRIENNNIVPSAVVMSPRTMNYIRKLTDTTGQFIPVPAWVPTRYVTKQIGDDFGSGSNESIIVTGNFSNLLLGVRDQMRIRIARDSQTLDRNEAWIYATMRVDVAVLRPTAFDVITGVLSSWDS